MAFAVYQFWWFTCIGYYRRRNHHRSLEFAIQKEKEWALIKPKDEDEYEEEEEAAAATPAEEEWSHWIVQSLWIAKGAVVLLSRGGKHNLTLSTIRLII